MEYVIFAAALAAVLLAVFLLEVSRAHREEKRFAESLYDSCEKLREKKYASERFERMGSYSQRHSEDGQIDDITWNDLGMDDIFKRMNYTLSATGEEYLYYTLRSLRRDKARLEHLEEVVQYFGQHPDERVRVQLAMRKLGHTGKFSLYDYLDNLDYLGERKSGMSILRDLLFLPLVALLWFNVPLAIMGITLLAAGNIASYFKEKGEIDPYIVSFAYIMRLADVCEKLEKHQIPVCTEEWERLKNHGKALQAMRRNSFWVLSPARGSANASGNPIEMIMDYIRMVFHVDLIKFNSMLKHLRGHIEDVDGLITVAGFLETAISVWAFRQSLTEGYCTPVFSDETEFVMEEGYHPLLEHPVKNSISAERGVLLTGSNASGKSTFLKTAAINAVLAQTIHTCTAGEYRAPLFYVYSSMALRDDIRGGESYYIVEIKALKRILDAASAGQRPVLCFVDEVLRGTNTVERISASTQILSSLGERGILCFAATHDIELTELLREKFDNYHFEEEVKDGDVVFNYRLLNGKATTRNAIRLLELMGYDEEIIRRANRQAEHFAREGEWEAYLT